MSGGAGSLEQSDEGDNSDFDDAHVGDQIIYDLLRARIFDW